MNIGSESNSAKSNSGTPIIDRGENAGNLIFEALNYLKGSLSADGGSCRPPNLARQKEDLHRWASGLGLLLSPSELPSKVFRGGQEHDLFHDEASDRYFKVTRNGIFGLSPGIDLQLVSSGKDGRCFHLWEATPLEYFERLHLQNQLVPGLNAFEGIIVQPNDDIAIVTSQPRFDIVKVTSSEIEEWFKRLGFEKIVESAYYRSSDNLGVFDAHEKNLVRGDQEVLIPFDVIPCHPKEGFRSFIEDTLTAGDTLRAVRTTHTAGR